MGFRYLASRIKYRVVSNRRFRALENNLRFRNSLRLALGDRNTGFFRPGWQTVDLLDADYLCDLREGSLPFEDSSVDSIYSSHLIEHATRSAGANLLGECQRILKTGGFLRLATPDLQLLCQRYEDGDWAWFLSSAGADILRRIAAREVPPESLFLHNRLVGWLASYSGRLSGGGGPIVNEEEVADKFRELDRYEFRDWCVSLLDPNRVPAHVHVYDFDELAELCQMAGFSKVSKTAYGDSACPAMSHPPIDRPEHREYSMYLEAQR